MVAVDTNILIYAHRLEYAAMHHRALESLRTLIEGADAWAIPWPCAHEFIAIVSHPRIFAHPTPIGESLDILAEFARSAGFQWLAESTGYFETLRKISEAANVQGPRIHDARIAALCLHHGVRELWTADRDFSAFPRLKTCNPLVR
jgi:uncharacterized protein